MSHSRANSTTKTYLRVIKRFLEWCKRKNLSVQLPFPVSTVSLYLFESHQSCASSASLIQTHAVLKWFHSFVPSLDRNPLDSEFCKNITESAKRTKSKPVAKKKPFSSQIIKDILDAFNKEGANLKDVRIAALCSLALAYGGPKGSNTNQFTKTQNSFPKHKSISQNTNQFTKTQISLPKHKTIS